MNYRFKYRRRLFWRSLTVQGHRFDPALDKMILYFANGGIEEIAKWSTCDLMLGPDWVLMLKKGMEESAGQSIPIKTGEHAK